MRKIVMSGQVVYHSKVPIKKLKKNCSLLNENKKIIKSIYLLNVLTNI